MMSKRGIEIKVFFKTKHKLITFISKTSTNSKSNKIFIGRKKYSQIITRYIRSYKQFPIVRNVRPFDARNVFVSVNLYNRYRCSDTPLFFPTFLFLERKGVTFFTSLVAFTEN